MVIDMTNVESYKGINSMHKYWGKKPFNVISGFINEYSEVGDVVLDSFCGSGVTLIESLKLNRKAIGVDLNPLANKLTRASVTKVDQIQLDKEFKKIKAELQHEINSLYETQCEKCGETTHQTHLIWTDGFPSEVWYKCSSCKSKKLIRDASLLDKLQAEDPYIQPLWTPDTVMFENSRINVKPGQKVSDLFTKRALTGLSLILNSIEKIEDRAVREILELTFTGAVSQASKLVFVIRRRNKNSSENEKGKAEVGSWVVGYWVPKEHFEINSWNCFENRYKKIVRGIEEINAVYTEEVQLVSSFEKLESTQSSCFVHHGTATKLPIPDSSIDYVFIDPPHGNRILYMEMSLMWNAWLKLDSNYDIEDEIIVSESKARNKKVNAYNGMMKESLNEIKRVLKEGKHFSLAFNSLDEETWLAMINLCVGVGLKVVEVVPLQYSANSVVQDNRQNALKTDFVVTCQKNRDFTSKEIVMNNSETDLFTDLKILLLEEKMETYNIINELYQRTIYLGYIYPPKKIINVLQKNFNLASNKWSI